MQHRSFENTMAAADTAVSNSSVAPRQQRGVAEQQHQGQQQQPQREQERSGDGMPAADDDIGDDSASAARVGGVDAPVTPTSHRHPPMTRASAPGDSGEVGVLRTPQGLPNLQLFSMPLNRQESTHHHHQQQQQQQEEESVVGSHSPFGSPRASPMRAGSMSASSHLAHEYSGGTAGGHAGQQQQQHALLAQDGDRYDGAHSSAPASWPMAGVSGTSEEAGVPVGVSPWQAMSAQALQAKFDSAMADPHFMQYQQQQHHHHHQHHQHHEGQGQQQQHGAFEEADLVQGQHHDQGGFENEDRASAAMARNQDARLLAEQQIKKV